MSLTATINNTNEQSRSFARQHGHLAACTIFRPFGKINHKDRKRRVIHHRGGSESACPYHLKIVCPWELDTEDESVLLVLIAMISTHSRIQKILPGHSCRADLKELGDWKEEITAGTITNRNEMLRHLGWSREGNSYRRLNESLERLKHTSIDYLPDVGRSMTSLFISINPIRKRGQESEERIIIALNPLSAAVIFGKCPHGVSVHEILERQLLNHSKVALGIYSQFVYLTKAGGQRDVFLSTLLRRLYGLDDCENPTPKQRELVATIIRNWNLPGWRVQLSKRGDAANVSIFRPKYDPNKIEPDFQRNAAALLMSKADALDE